MIPAGYLLKWTPPPPGWLHPNPSNIAEVCSVSDCVNENVINLLDCWKFNQFGLANSIKTLLDLAQSAGASLSKASLFFYSTYENELESDGWEFDPDGWRALTLTESSNVEKDVVSPPHTATRRCLDTMLSLMAIFRITLPSRVTQWALSCRSTSIVSSTISLQRKPQLTKESLAVGARMASTGYYPSVA